MCTPGPQIPPAHTRAPHNTPGRTAPRTHDDQPINQQKKPKTTYRNSTPTYTDGTQHNRKLITKTKTRNTQLKKSQQNQINNKQETNDQSWTFNKPTSPLEKQEQT